MYFSLVIEKTVERWNYNSQTIRFLFVTLENCIDDKWNELKIVCMLILKKFQVKEVKVRYNWKLKSEIFIKYS